MKYFVFMVMVSLGAFAQDDCEPTGELFYVAITESNDAVIKTHNTFGAAGCPAVVGTGVGVADGDAESDSFLEGNRYLVFFTGFDGRYKLRLTLVQSVIDKSPRVVSGLESVSLHNVKKTTFSQDFSLDSNNTGVFEFELNGWEYNFVVKGLSGGEKGVQQ